ncbi:MAG TPA: hypothetical protein VEL47_06330 [Myxococcota bacterium]|nr:hypothetical protein [Myxococcota bacterium]
MARIIVFGWVFLTSVSVFAQEDNSALCSILRLKYGKYVFIHDGFKKISSNIETLLEEYGINKRLFLREDKKAIQDIGNYFADRAQDTWKSSCNIEATFKAAVKGAIVEGKETVQTPASEKLRQALNAAFSALSKLAAQHALDPVEFEESQSLVALTEGLKKLQALEKLYKAMRSELEDYPSLAILANIEGNLKFEICNRQTVMQPSICLAP